MRLNDKFKALYNRLLLLLFSFCITISIYSQEKYNKTGQVFSSENFQPIDYATIILLNTTKDSLIVTYAETNLEGKFSITFNKTESDNYAVKVHKLGFESKIIELKNQIDFQNIILVPKNIQLQEVKITSTRPIRLKKDTTFYDLKQFSNGTENTLEDVLKKLPGLEVSENGIISFNGKSIYKILIEGDNFFSEDYQILSKNLTPELISSIEAIENFNDQKLLRGIKRSDQVVLNLKLDENLKPSLFGNVSGGGGIKNRYNSKGILFSILNKFKIGYVGNLNNIGEQPLTQINDNFGLARNKTRDINDYLNSDSYKSTIINHPNVFIPNIDRDKYIDSRYNLQALQTNVDISPSVNFKNYAYLYFDKFENISNNQIRFIGNANDTLFVTENSFLEKNRNIFNNHSEFDIEVDTLSSIHLISNISKDRPKTSNNIASQYANSVDDFRRTENMDKLKLYNFDLEFNRKVSSSAILQLYSNLSDETKKQNLILKSDRFNDSFETDSLNQKIHSWRHTIYLGANYIKNYNKHNFEFGIIYSKRKSDLKSELNQKDSLDLYFDAFYNNLTLINKNFRVKLSHNYELNERTSLNSKFFLNKLYLRRRDNYLQTALEKKYFLFGSILTLDYKSISGHRFNFSTSLENNVSDITDLYDNNVLTNLRTIQVKSEEINISKDWMFDLRYSYFNGSNFYKIIFGGNYKFRSSPYNLSLKTSDLLNIIQQTPSDLGVSNGNIYSDINKLFYIIKSRIGLKGQLGFSEISRKVNELQYNQQTQNYSVGAYLITGMKGWVNFKGNLDYFKTIIPRDNFTDRFSTEKLDLNISAIIKPNENFNANLIYQRIHWPNLNSNFLTFNTTFDPKSFPRLSSQLGIRNIFNTKSLGYDNFSPAIVRMNTYSIVPRMVYLTLTWNLTK